MLFWWGSGAGVVAPPPPPPCEREGAPWSPAPGPSAGPGAERTGLRNGEQSGSACWGRALGARAVTASGECLCQALCVPRRLPARVSSACFTSPREGCGICPRVRCVICPRRSAGRVVGSCARVRVPRCGRGRAALSPGALFTSTRGVPHGPAERRRQLGLGFGARGPPPREIPSRCFEIWGECIVTSASPYPPP